MSLRKTLFWIHLATGCVAGIIVLVMSVTGVLLAYERQIVGWSDRAFRSTPPSLGSPRLPIEEMLANVTARNATLPSAIAVRTDPAAPAEVSFGREHVFLVDVYTGTVLGEGSQTTRSFFQKVENWHRWLAASNENRAVGRAVTGACNFGFLLLVVSGPFLWMPRRWSWQSVKAVALFRGGLSGRARDFNWHNVIGIWCAAPLFLIVLSGVVMSYPWANNLLYRLTGNEPPVQGNRQGERPRRGEEAKPSAHRAQSPVGPSRTTNSRLAEPDFAPAAARPHDLHHRHRKWGTSRSTFPVNARQAHRGSHPLGAFFKLQRGPPPAVVVSFYAHWRSRRDCGPDRRGSRDQRRCDIGLDWSLARLPPLGALEKTQPSSQQRRRRTRRRDFAQMTRRFTVMLDSRSASKKERTIHRMKGSVKVIAQLNEALKEELTAINQYFLHAEMCENWHYHKIANHIRKESIDEMKHAELLIERILFLDGAPSMTEPMKISVGASVKDQLASDLELELKAFAMYNKAVQIARDEADNASRELFERILKEEEGHIDWLEAQIHQIKELGYERYLSQQIGAE